MATGPDPPGQPKEMEMSVFPKQRVRFGGMVVQPTEVEMTRSWLSPNGRLRLIEVIKKRPRQVSLESQVMWETFQGEDKKMDLVILEKAIQEVYKDLQRLKRHSQAGVTGEQVFAYASQFHYYPSKDILLLTLDTLQVQRKEMFRGFCRSGSPTPVPPREPSWKP